MNQEMRESLNLFKLSKKKIIKVVGGSGNCCCACAYSETGGSSPYNNGQANNKEDKWSPPCLRSTDQITLSFFDE